MEEKSPRDIIDEFGTLKCGAMQSRVNAALDKARTMQTVSEAFQHLRSFSDQCFEHTFRQGKTPPDDIPVEDVRVTVERVNELVMTLGRNVPMRSLLTTVNRTTNGGLTYSRDLLHAWLPPDHWEEVQRCCTANATPQCQALATAIIVALIENAITFADEFEGHVDVGRLRYALDCEQHAPITA